MVQNLEKGLGVPVLIRRKGGANREGATLTEFALQFLALYREFNKRAKGSLSTPFSWFKEELGSLREEYDEDGGEA
jgi:molybdate transport system regulatory protein